MQKNFIKKEIDVMNVILCMLVVFIHITSEAVSTLRVGTWQYLIIYIPHKLSSFVVYGFIFISAVKLFMKDIEKIKLLEYYKNRIKKIVIPYVFSVLIYYIYFILKDYFGFSSVELIRYICTGDLVAHFYFIIIIVQFYFLFPLWKKVINHSNVLITICFSCIITLCFTKYLPIWLSDIFNEYKFIYNDRIFTTYLLYWISGAYAGKNYEKFYDFLTTKAKSITISFLCISIIYLAINYNFVINKTFVECLTALQLIYNILAILFVYSMCIKISNKEKIILAIEPVNKNSYSIYLYHVLIIFIINEILSKFNIVGMAERLFIKMFFVYFILISISFFKKIGKLHIFVQKVLNICFI